MGSIDIIRDPGPRIREILKAFIGTEEIGSFVNGEIVFGSGEKLTLTDPSSGKSFATYKDADSSVVDSAMDAAARAQRAWMQLTASGRGRVMNEIARTIREHSADIAEIESRSAGRPIRDIRGEVVKVAEMFEYYAGWCDKLHGDVIPVPTSHLNYTRQNRSAWLYRSRRGTHR